MGALGCSLVSLVVNPALFPSLPLASIAFFPSPFSFPPSLSPFRSSSPALEREFWGITPGDFFFKFYIVAGEF